jgi:hypothetical protein
MRGVLLCVTYGAQAMFQRTVQLFVYLICRACIGLPFLLCWNFFRYLGETVRGSD